MKRYKLLKDLPMFDAGEEGFYLDSDGNLMHGSSDTGETVYPAPVLARHPEILRDWFEEIPERPKTVWDLKKGDMMAVIDEDFEAFEREWDDDASDHYIRSMGDVFLTKEDAEKELARRKAKVILERDTKGFKPKKNSGLFYTVFWDVHDEIFRIEDWDSDYRWARQYSDLVFAIKEDAMASIKAHPNEWRTYLGVEQ